MQNEYAEKNIAYKELIIDSTPTPNITEQNFINNTAQDNIGIFNDVEVLSKTDLSSAQSLNVSIVTENVMEYYKKEFNNIYLTTIATDTLKPDNNDWQVLESMSELNAIENGEAVYWARAVTKSLKEDSYNSFRKKRNIEESVQSIFDNYIIYPNPAHNVITVKAIKNINESISLFIYDIAGKEIMNEQILFNENVTEINVSHLVNGSYRVNISSSSCSSHNVNLIIIH